MKLASIVLAAGSSTRFGSDKLLAEFCGRALLSHALDAACAAPVEQVILVCRSGTRLLVPSRVQRVEFDGQAISASIKAGLAALGPVDGAFIFLGDMPGIPAYVPSMLRDVLADNFAAFPVHAAQQGHPVLFAKRAFPALRALSEDTGASVLLRNRSDVVRLPCDDAGVLRDVDTPGDLEDLKLA